MTDNRTTELLRECPFCGNEPWEPMPKRWTNALGDESWSAYVHCPECKLTIETKACGYETADGAVKAITERWNTRTPEQAIAASLGSEREKALEELVRDMSAALIRDNCYRWCEAKKPCNLITDGKCQYRERIRELGIEVVTDER